MQFPSFCKAGLSGEKQWGIEVPVFNQPETVPARYHCRRLARHTPKIMDLCLNKAMAVVGEEVARRLEHTKSEAIFLIPSAGYDA
jgi:uncharacterized protein (UPF0261 family)